MLPTFLAQLASGSAIAVACAPIQQVGRQYLRLMAIVCLSIAVLALALILRESGWPDAGPRQLGAILLAAGAIPIAVWIFVNAAQGDSIRFTQRLLAGIGGLIWLCAAIALIGSTDALVGGATSQSGIPSLTAAVSTILGAALLGTATAAMLLGHRYLTDTGMSIAPLRRLAGLYLGVVIVRGIWVCAASFPIWSNAHVLKGTYVWFWLMICVRLGVGVLGVGIFAWMVWDCVKRRATQSATALFYLSMIFIFLGELSGQYLQRSESLSM